jgi:hypothetical protein
MTSPIVSQLENSHITADIALPRTEVVRRFAEALNVSHGLVTRPVIQGVYHFQSDGHIQSVVATVLKARLSTLIWTVQDFGPEKSRISIRFDLSNRSKLRLYGLQALLILSYALIFWLWSKGVGFGPLSGAGVLIALVTSILLLAVSVLLLTSKYIVRGTNILHSIATSTGSQSSQLVLVRGPAPRRLVINLAFMGFSVISLVGITIFLAADLFPVSYISTQVIGVGIFALIGLTAPTVVNLFVSRRRFSEFAERKFAPLSLHLYLTLPIITSLWAPYVCSSWIIVETSNWPIFANSSASLTSVYRNIVPCILSNVLVFLLIPLLFLPGLVRLCATVYGRNVSTHQYTIAAYWKEAEKGYRQPPSFIQPPGLKFITYFAFFWQSAMSWLGVYLSGTVILELITRQHNSIFDWPGSPIVAIYDHLIESMNLTGIDHVDWSIVTFCWLGPFLLPTSILGVLHIGALLKMRGEARKLVPWKDSRVRHVERLAVAMGVFGVQCVVNEQSQMVSPCADIRGWNARKLIVFSPASLQFMSQYPRFFEAIVAHELAHLKLHSRGIRRRRIMSRCGLVGVGFLSMVNDSIQMEDEADNAARAYLHDKDAIRAAAIAMEAWLLRAFVSSTSCDESYVLPFGAVTLTDSIVRFMNAKSLSVLSRLKSAIQMVLTIYLFAELYEYIHRDAWRR